MASDQNKNRQKPVAIIGMDCLFPGARGLHEYWRVIRRGEDCISDVPESHWKISDFCTDNPDLRDMIECRRGGFLSETTFDPIEFGIPPSVLEATDTAQLLSLMVAKRALKDAGYDNGRQFDRDRVGVILGVTGTQELVLPLSARLGHPLWRQALREAGIPADMAEKVVQGIADGYVDWQENSFPGLLGNVVAGRIASRLDLHGTNCVVDAACASSLSAIHMAAMELDSGRSDMVVTGGVDTLNDIFMFMCFHKAQALSPTGDARPFAQDADGTVVGEGVGILVLKRLEDAVRDGDKVYAVLKSVGTSSDGRSQSIYAPHAPGQARALRGAYEISNIDPVTIELVEAHGTGTKVGDLTEFDALKTVYRESASEGKWCAIGSVKSQIGHAKAASGAASMIKAVLALYNRVLPATIKIDQPNPKLEVEDSPFYVSTETRPWLTAGDHPRRAAVSSFGFGGSNFHAVLEEYGGATREPAWDGSVEIAALSAADAAGLLVRLDEWDAAASGGLDGHKLAVLASRSRREFSAKDEFRLVLVIERGANLNKLIADAKAALKQKGVEQAWQAPNIYFGGAADPGKLAFIFPGQGSQYVGMGRDLVCHFPEGFDAVEQACQEFEGDQRLNEYIYPTPTFDGGRRAAREEHLKRTEVTQPALGAVSTAMVRILKRFGIEPDFAAGHSFGELVALRTAGRIGDEALRMLAQLRGRLMGVDKDEGGAMLAVQAPLEEIDKLLKETGGDDVVLANRNTPTQGILSGARQKVEKIGAACERRGWRTRMLQVSAAFHSKFMATARKKFRAALDELTFELGRIPVFANVTGEHYPEDATSVRDLLARQLTHPVHFVEMVRNLYDAGVRTFVEIGPKNVLTGLVKNILQGKSLNAIAVDAGLGRGAGVLDLARALALLTVLGYSVDLQAWERPAPETIEPKMPVLLCGANYRNPAKYKPVSHTQTTTQTQSEFGNISMNNIEDGGARVDTNAAPTARADHLTQAFQVVQEGLRSMQALQQQTAAAHERFLQTQEHAHRTFQMVIAQQQQLLTSGLELPTDAAPPPIVAVPPPEPVPIAQAPPPEPVAAPIMTDAPPVSSSGNGETLAAAPPPTVEQIASGDKNDGAAPGDFSRIVLDAVSELTGYPTEMLELDMDMEADLGIDSIKRLEILGSVQKRVPEMADVNSQYMGSLRTLRNIIEYAEGTTKEAAGSDPTSAPARPDAVPERQVEQPAACLERRVLAAVELAPAKQRPLRIAKGHEVWVTDDGTPLAPTIVKRLEKLGCVARVIGSRAGWRGTTDKKIGGLILLAAARDADESDWREESEAELKAAFKRVKLLGPNLRQAAENGGALLATVARLDGAFGLNGGSYDALPGGLSGLLKTAAREWPDVHCRALDIAPAWRDQDAASDAIVSELVAEGPIETGVSEDRRIGLELKTASITAGELPLDDGDVVVISGGARGVTAEAALALAQTRRLTLVLLGRSPAPSLEPEWLAELDNEASIKRVLLAKAFDDGRPTPKDLEAEYRRRLANREIAGNLQRLRDAGATVEYRAADVRDGEAVAAVLDEIRELHGPVRGLIHAAGVLADHLIEDKTPEQFDLVFDTKVGGLRALLEAARDDDLKCMAFFSSVSGRFGNEGQVDYAMANEVMNKIARRENARRPNCRVVSINWGPWDGGMVTPNLKQEFVRMGVDLIPLEEGTRFMVEELSRPPGEDVEIVVGAGFPDPLRSEIESCARRCAAPGAAKSVAFERMIDIESHPFLCSHVLNGRPVLPMALIQEWLGQGALHNNPGLQFRGLDDVRILKGVVLDGKSKNVRVLTSNPRREDDVFKVNVELRGDANTLYSRARAVLSTNPPETEAFEPPADLDETLYPFDAAEIYREQLFHGAHFHAIERVTGMSPDGMTAHVHAAPTPNEWMSEPLRPVWLGDPLMIDAAYQLGILWSRRYLDAAALPSYCRSYAQYATTFPERGVNIALLVTDKAPKRLTADAHLLDADGRLLATCAGVEWTVDQSLNSAFTKNELVGA